MANSLLPDDWSQLASDATLRPEATVRPGGTDTLPATGRTAPRLPSISLDLRDAPAQPQRSEDSSDLQLRGLIGEGGMGRVLLARQHSLSRDVAVKTAKSDAAQSARDALIVEGTITGQLEHPAIVPVHALGLDSAGWPAMVMKRIEGVTWDGLLADPAHAGWEGWEGSPADRLPGHLQILSQVCNALHFAHSRGFVHRDVKPQNVLIGRFGDVYLADWGVAAQPGEGRSQLCGTPAFLAPEMVEGRAVDARTDVYLLGATLHVVLTGQPRHPGATITESLLHARASPPFTYAPEVPEELAALANRACHLDPAQRPQSAQAFRDELALYVRHRDARALGQEGIKRVEELDQLLTLPSPDEAQRRRVERLLLEARFGLEQALSQWEGNAPARAALQRVEALVEERQKRTAALEEDARERDPATGAGWRTLALAGVTLLTGFAGLFALGATREPSPIELVAFAAGMTAIFAFDAALLRKHLLSTRFNRQVFGTLMVALVLMVLGRVVGLWVPTPAHEHFARDCFVTVAVAAVAAFTLVRWAWVVAFFYLVAGVLCMALPVHSLQIFSGFAVVSMAAATFASWWTWRALRRGRSVA